MSYHHFVDTTQDSRFAAIADLRWTPWLGSRHQNSGEPKLLIIGESHYAEASGGSSVESVRKHHEADQTFTREILWETIFGVGKKIKSIASITPLFVGTTKCRLEEFWKSVAFYNIVQRMVTPSERPSRDDFSLGWRVFVEVFRILKPDYCGFIGSQAHHTFWPSMKGVGAGMPDPKLGEKIGRCWSYPYDLRIDGMSIPIVFIQHPGRCFNSGRWHDYLLRKFPIEIKSLIERYEIQGVS